MDIGAPHPSATAATPRARMHSGEPDPSFLADYAVLVEAQAKACESVAPGMTCEEIDALQEHFADAQLDEFFIHRTGHGIGLETHEEPYIVSGNQRRLEPGMAFSVEPGFIELARSAHGSRTSSCVASTGRSCATSDRTN